MSSTFRGFLKCALEPETIAALVGGAAGAAISGGTTLNRLGVGAAGASLAMGTVSGIRALTEDIDAEGLTAGEIAVLREEAEKQDRWRHLTRIMAAGGGIGSAALLRSPMPLIAAIPAMTIAPIGHDAASLRRTAKHFRAARRSS